MTEASNGGNMLSGSGANFKTISEAKSFHVGLSSIKGDYFSTVVTPVMFQKDKALYPACSQPGPEGKGCNRKVR